MDCIDGAVGGERGKCIKWDAGRRMHGTAITPRLPILLHSSIHTAMQCNAKENGQMHDIAMDCVRCWDVMTPEPQGNYPSVRWNTKQHNETQTTQCNAMKYTICCGRPTLYLACIFNIIFCKRTKQTGRSEVCQI